MAEARGALAVATAAALVVTGSSAWAQSLGLSLDGEVGATFGINKDGDYDLSGDFVLRGETATRSQRAFFELGFSTTYESVGDTFEPFNPSVLLGFEQTAKRSTFGVDARYSVDPVSFTDITDDLIFIDSTGLRTELSFGADFSHQLSRLTSVGLSASYTDVDFTDTSPDLIPSRTFELDASLTRELTQRTSVTAELGYSDFESDDIGSTRSKTVTATGSVAHQATELLSFDGSLGVGRTETDNTVSGSSSDTNLEASLDVTYALQSSTLTAGLSQTIEPGSEGSVELTSRADVGYSRDLTHNSGISLAAALTRRSGLAGGASESAFEFDATYDRALTRVLNGSLGYEFTKTDGSDADHRVTVSVTRSFQLLK